MNTATIHNGSEPEITLELGPLVEDDPDALGVQWDGDDMIVVGQDAVTGTSRTFRLTNVRPLPSSSPRDISPVEFSFNYNPIVPLPVRGEDDLIGEG